LIPLRARLIFATHQDLSSMVTEGRFRQDLYYRINVMRIDAPSLQEHAEDIPTIAMHFLRNYSEQYGKFVDSIDPSAMALLQGYSWPGNVRELENVIQRAIIVAKETNISVQNLPGNVLEEGAVGTDDCPSTSSFERQIRDFKLRLATDAVREHAGNKTLAARSLQISRAYLHRLIRPIGPALVGDEMAGLQEQAQGLGQV
jgi:DNA-binding NtrC family response regulator